MYVPDDEWSSTCVVMTWRKKYEEQKINEIGFTNIQIVHIILKYNIIIYVKIIIKTIPVCFTLSVIEALQVQTVAEKNRTAVYNQ